MLWIWIILELLFILFIPIRIKFTFLYQNGKIYIYFFNWQLKIKEKVSEEKANMDNAKKAERKLHKLLPKDIKSTILKLSKNRFKPGIKIKLEMNYGFEDAALTGVCSGILHSFSPILYKFSGRMFRVKEYEYIINPQFNNPMLNIRIISIISVNLAKIIYILFIIYLY